MKGASELAILWDLFSGLGGASRSFAVDPNWKVIRIENNPELSAVPFTLQHDVLDWPEWSVGLETPDFVWASPPCLEFSNAFSAPAPKARRAGLEFTPDLSLVNAALAIIKEFNPKWWAIENVAGAIPTLNPILGQPQKAGPFFIWGNIPKLVLPMDYTHLKAEVDKRWSPLRSNIKAEIPITISKAVKAAIEEQKTLEDFQ